MLLELLMSTSNLENCSAAGSFAIACSITGVGTISMDSSTATLGSSTIGVSSIIAYSGSSLMEEALRLIYLDDLLFEIRRMYYSASL